MEGLGIENICIFYGQLNISRPFGIFKSHCYGNLVYFTPFWYMRQGKSGNPDSECKSCAIQQNVRIEKKQARSFRIIRSSFALIGNEAFQTG
jgi:hypothetical protein